MNMRGSSRRATGVALASFGWRNATLATMRHSSLPFGEVIAATPLGNLGKVGTRDRLSLVAQFAAHQAFLRFAGIADGELDAAEWAVVQKRGEDVRLVRTAARACDPADAPPPIALVQAFAELAGADVDILRQSWARADAIFAEVFQRLDGDVAADLRWTRSAAIGCIAAPGPAALDAIAREVGSFSYEDDECAISVQRFAESDHTFGVTQLQGASPLARYSALGTLVRDRSVDPKSAAESIAAAIAGRREVFIVTDLAAFDGASREVVEILSSGSHGTWLWNGARERLPATEWFIVAPRLTAAARLRSELGPELRDFVHSTAFSAYLASGETPARRTPLAAIAEPIRSYLGALSLVGVGIDRESAAAFLAEFLHRGAIDELAVEGVTKVSADAIAFVNDDVRVEASRVIPASSRPAIARVAAKYASGFAAVSLWLDAGEPALAADALDHIASPPPDEVVAVLGRVPPSMLTSPLSHAYADALVACGRYRDAREAAKNLEDSDRELILARAERRSGDYGTALARLERLRARSFESELLRGEILRLLGRADEAAHAFDACAPRDDADEIRLAYERAVLAFDNGETAKLETPQPHYLASRFATYVALRRADYDEAARCATKARELACTTTERIDASLDRIFTAFSAGDWREARALAVAALAEVEETQGDRGAGGILFTLAYLAADEAQWAHATQCIARLRRYYSGTNDDLRFGELQLLAAHLDFARGRFADARRNAEAVYGRRTSQQMREAAALILDEIDLVEGKNTPLRSTGDSGNAELTRRHRRLVAADAEPLTDAIPDQLFAFRRALARHDERTARAIATKFDLTFEDSTTPPDVELRMLRAAAVREYPFAPRDFDLPWCFATRNRLGQWNVIGSEAPAPETLDSVLRDGAGDWIVCGDRELLFVDGCSRWSGEARDAISSLFRTRAENQRLHRVVEQEENARVTTVDAVDGIVGRSPAIRDLFNVITRVARRDVAVCVLGESGTGKELVARAIHRYSVRRPKPFTAVNCAALPENLIESELFGHVRGAFTGADRDRAGLIETTDGGTLFLDEIGEMPLTAQAKLLRFLQEGEFRRVGDTANRAADVRIVSATNRKLETAVDEGRFRDDLYYRIRGVELTLPPLRERGADILLLATHFLVSERERHRGGPTVLSTDVEAIFSAYGWPGNVRELQNTIRAAHAIAGDSRQIDIEHLPERLRSIAPARAAAGSYQDAVARFKRDLIERSLEEAEGNQNRAAAILKMSRQALAYQIRELGIMVKR